MYSTPPQRSYMVEQRPRLVPLYGNRQKDFAIIAPPSRLLSSSSTKFTPTLGHSYRLVEADAKEFNDSKNSKNTQCGKGLRHFSMKVCEKVKAKGTTTYNEVADELVSEYFEALNDLPDQRFQSYDMKNIRRRVYDALNVLMAMNIIEKHGKEIRWNGLPTSSVQELKMMEHEKQRKEERLQEKCESAMELIMQLAAYKNLIDRNKQREAENVPVDRDNVLYLPFLVVAAEFGSETDIQISHDKSEYLFQFERPYELYDDVEALKRCGLTDGLDVQATHIDRTVRDRIKLHMPPKLKSFVESVFNEVTSLRLEKSAAYAEKTYHQPYVIVRPSTSGGMPIITQNPRALAGVVAKPAPSSVGPGSMGVSRVHPSQSQHPAVQCQQGVVRYRYPVQSAPARPKTVQHLHQPMVHQPVTSYGDNSQFRPMVYKKEPVYKYSRSVSAAELESIEMNALNADEYDGVLFEEVGAQEEIGYE